ncbi:MULTISPECIES: hypothetical protein [unclassified Clostridioides]|uniref:hypothetical protein n=1 Tax=unclassified Clostridioides TaxID=2635829 RepID=UPI001D0CD40F|nr:hypothetical protein [Clostridioides sp. ES-S-0049-03]MCC0656031.1 hypothetical protein [Clostridioides sp. ES-S-0123-01]MCC0676289.1 hypothetical protein [Clostridioides sp. ES-W-0018-02]MCC0711510.1 hypothetical protein [Clostridioides sp. ES-W-0017-02]MCC0762755.1 hypothetical protein [Clostridioides sp. ES-S-0006-03]UDN61455.1 hypothetical protein IC758_16630 [Clostridioides sp. ES-W-0016-02]
MKITKSHIVALLLVATTSLTIGCESANNNNKSNKITQVPSDTQSVSNFTLEKMDKLNKEVLPQVEKLFKENGIEIKDREFDEGIEKKPGDIYKTHMNNSNTTIGDILIAEYISKANEGSWRVTLAINTDKDTFKGNKFKVEDTLFHSLSNIIVKNNIDYSDLNNQINELASNEDGKLKSVNIESGDFNIGVLLTGKYIMFDITLIN